MHWRQRQPSVHTAPARRRRTSMGHRGSSSPFAISSGRGASSGSECGASYCSNKPAGMSGAGRWSAGGALARRLRDGCAAAAGGQQQHQQLWPARSSPSSCTTPARTRQQAVPHRRRDLRSDLLVARRLRRRLLHCRLGRLLRRRLPLASRQILSSRLEHSLDGLHPAKVPPLLYRPPKPLHPNHGRGDRHALVRRRREPGVHAAQAHARHADAGGVHVGPAGERCGRQVRRRQSSVVPHTPSST